MKDLRTYLLSFITLRTALLMYLLAFPVFCWIAVTQSNGAGLVELFAGAGGILLWLMKQPQTNANKGNTSP